MLDTLIITKSWQIISILKNLGFTKFENYKGEIYINDTEYRWAMREIRIALIDAGLRLRYAALKDVICILAANGADLETGKNATIDLIPQNKNPQAVYGQRGF
jgi:hypothetical protein